MEPGPGPANRPRYHAPVPASLKDVARLAGVSPITVSRALSGTHVVAPATKERVMKAVARLNYVPDLLARGLVRQRSSTLGLVVPELANPFFVTLVDAVQTAARARDHLLVVSQSARQLAEEELAVRQFLQLRVAGVLAVPVAGRTDHLDEMAEAGTAVVVVARRSARHDFVAVDDVRGGRLAAEHLLSRGHRRVGLVTPDQPDNTAIQDRLRSFLEALRAGGGRLPPEARLTTAGVQIPDGFAAAERFLALAERPTAVFLTADHLAMGFLQALRRRGVRVPADVAIMGYDDIVYSRYLDVPLTTIELPLKQLGERAVQALFERIARPRGRRIQVLLEPRLVVRDSTG